MGSFNRPRFVGPYYKIQQNQKTRQNQIKIKYTQSASAQFLYFFLFFRTYPVCVVFSFVLWIDNKVKCPCLSVLVDSSALDMTINKSLDKNKNDLYTAYTTNSEFNVESSVNKRGNAAFRRIY